MGDFNLDEYKRYNLDYSHKSYYETLDKIFEPLGLIPLIDFYTWSRTVNAEWKESLIDLCSHC